MPVTMRTPAGAGAAVFRARHEAKGSARASLASGSAATVARRAQNGQL